MAKLYNMAKGAKMVKKTVWLSEEIVEEVKRAMIEEMHQTERLITFQAMVAKLLRLGLEKYVQQKAGEAG